MNHRENMTLKATVEMPRKDSGDGDDRQKVSLSDLFSWPGRIALLLAVVLSPWVFASVENWAQCWISIALLVGLAFWWFDTALNNRKTQVFPYVAFMVFLGLGIGLFQTTLLSDWMADVFLGRQLEIYSNYSGDASAPASVSLDRDGTWRHVRLLIIAISGLLLGCRFFRSKRDLVLLLSVVAINGAAISFFGVIHKLTDNGKMFWFHELLNGGGPFGPFVNRNNAAGYLLISLGCCLGLIPIVMAQRKSSGSRPIISKEIPIWRQWYFQLMEFLSELTAVKIAVMLGVVLIAAAIPASLSRGGVLGLLVASIGTILCFGMARQPKNSSLVLIPLIVFVMALFGWIGLGDELMERFDRIDMVNLDEADSRVQHWQDTWPAVNDMGLLGSGLGAYKSVHRLYRTDNERAIFHYAENNFFQSLVEAGWGGLFLFLVAWLLAFNYARLTLFEGSSPTTIGIGTAGVFVVLSQFVVSFFDFGLYIPANMLLFAVVIGLLAYHAQSLAGRLKRKSWLRFKFPNYLVQVVVLILFAAVTMVALDLSRRTSIDRLLRPRAARLDRFNMDLLESEIRLASLTPKIQRTPSVAALNYAGEIWLHRSRLEFFESLTNLQQYQDAIAVMSEEKKDEYLEGLWQLSNLRNMQGTVSVLRRDQPREVAGFLAENSIQKRLPVALSYFKLSRQKAPLQPLVHLRIGEIKGIIARPGDGDVDIERALELAPSNAIFRKVAGIYYLQSDNVAGAVPHLKKYLQLNPRRFSQLMKLLTGPSLPGIRRIDPSAFSQIIPDDAKMLYGYAAGYLDRDSPQFELILKRAVVAIEDAPFSIRENDVLLGDVRRLLDDQTGAVEAYHAALLRQPYDPKTRYKLAKLLFELQRLDEALEEAEYLKSHSHSNATYNKFLRDVESAIWQRDKDK